MADRACNRCISKKRRCDHARPVCGTCKKLKLHGECVYPPPQARRGPVAGMSRRAEHRAQQCENALWFLLNLPGVKDAMDRADNNILNGPFTPAPTARLERAARNDWWGEHTMRRPGDIWMFRDACRELEAQLASQPDGETNGPAIAHDSEAYDYERVPRTPTPLEHSASNSGSVSQGGSSEASHPKALAKDKELLENAEETTSAPRRRDDSAMRNAMGPSLWHLVSAAIPDEVEENANSVPRLPSMRSALEPDAIEEGRLPRPPSWATTGPLWSAPPPTEDSKYIAKRKRRADIFW